MDIQRGGTVSQENMRVMFGGVSGDERQRARRQSGAMRGRDTTAVVWIIEGLRGTVGAWPGGRGHHPGA